MNYWLIKSEPDAYSWEQLKKDKKTSWTGVRNYTARNNLKAMKKGDLCTPFVAGIVDAPTPKTRDGSSFGTPLPNGKEPTEDKFGGGVQYDSVGSKSSKQS